MRITNISNLPKFGNTKHISLKKREEKKDEKEQIQLPPYSSFYSSTYVPNILIARQQKGMPEFFDFLTNIKIGDKSLASNIKDFKFAFNPNFDKDAWINFLTEMNESVAVFDSTGEEKTFLSKLLQNHSIDKLLNNKDFKPNKAISFLDELDERSDEEISEIPLTAQLSFMVDVAGSDIDIKEYVDDMFYFVRLEDPNGDKFLSEYAGKMNGNKIDVLKHLLNVDRGSVEASNMQMLLELVQKGVVGKHIFDVIPFDGKVNSFVASDIDKLYKAYLENVEPIDAFVPPVETHSEAQALLSVGDVYELENEKNIFILDKNLEPLQLGIDKETYFELFPPIERYATTQNDIGNCWEITAFNTLLTDPQERYSVLSLFEQKGDSISIHFPSNKAGKMVFDDGELPMGVNPNYYSKGPKGIQLLEYAHGREEHEEEIQTLIKQIEVVLKSATTEERKKELAEKTQILQEMLDTDRDNVVISLNPKTYEWSFEMWDKEKHGFDNAITHCRDGGDPIMLFKKLGYTVANVKDDDLLVYSLISNPKNFEDYIITFGTKEDDFEFPKNSPLISDHSYRIYPLTIDKATGKVTDFKLVDPCGIIETTMSGIDLRKHNGIFSLARRDKTDKSKIIIK